MAANSKKTKRRYPGSRPVDGNLARKLNTRELERQLDRSGRMDFDQLYEPQKDSAVERNARRRQQMRSAVRPTIMMGPPRTAGLPDGAAGIFVRGLFDGGAAAVLCTDEYHFPEHCLYEK